MALTLTSSAFRNGERIPATYTCDGDNVSPPLSIAGVPEGTVELVLIMDDPDIPREIKETRGIEIFDHWVLFNIPPGTTEIGEGERIGTAGANSRGAAGYTGPCPPPEYEPKEHRYFFRLYALAAPVELSEGATKADVLTHIESNVLETAELVGRYARI